MQLDEYISATIHSVMKALSDTDKRLRDEKLGCVWRADLITSAEALVNVRLVKARDPGNLKESIPVILFDYDVNVAVSDEGGSWDQTEIGVAAKLLRVVTLGAKVKGESRTQHVQNEVQNLKFTVPISLRAVAE